MPVSFPTIRPFLPPDCHRVLCLWRNTEGIGLDKSDTLEGIQTFLARNEGLSLVAESSEGEIVAAVLCGHDGRRGYLHHLAVAKPFRGLGVAQTLIETCLRNLQQLGLTKCNLHVFASNESGRKFWAKQGWAIREDLVLVQKIFA